MYSIDIQCFTISIYIPATPQFAPAAYTRVGRHPIGNGGPHGPMRRRTRSLPGRCHHHITTLEVLHVDISRRRHGAAQRTYEIRLAVGQMARPIEDFLECADSAHVRAHAARQACMARFGAPVGAVPWRLCGAGERAPSIAASAPMANAVTKLPESPMPPSAMTCT